MLISMTPNEEVKTIHASLNDGKLRKWEFEPYTENGKIELTDQDYATIQSIKGKTVKFNQMVQNGNFASTSGWEVYLSNYATLSISNNIARVTCITNPTLIYQVALQSVETISKADLVFKHKIIVAFDMRSNRTFNVRIEPYANSSSFGTRPTYNGNGNKQRLLSYTDLSTGTYVKQNRIFIYPDILFNVDDYFEISNVQLFDLTQIFGSGDEPTTVSDFETWLSNNIGLLPYYDYTLGDLISFNGTGLKTENASQTESNTLSLPISTYFPTGMKSAGNVYDELTESKATTRIGSRAYQSGDEDDTSVITDGTTTYYALTTPTEVDISLDLSYDVWDNGTEQILPVNSSTPTTSSMKATIEYPDRTEEVNFLYKQTTFESAIPQFSLVCKNQELPMALEDGKLICECDSSITNESGFFDCKVKMQDLNSVAYSQKIQLHVERGIND